MKTSIATAILAAAMTTVSAQAVMAQSDLDEITVGYFLEWPLPMLAAKNAGAYEEALGVDINWRSFDTGTAMSAAMASGDVQLSVSQGVPPFVVASSAGLGIQALDVAVSYAENDNCVVATALEIDKENAGDLAGSKVAVPLGTAAHYGFLRQMDHFGIDLGSLEVVDMAPAEGAAALSQGAVDLACGWGGGLNRMKEHGNILLTGAEKEDLGILVFDVTSAPEDFVALNPDMVADFLKVTADANAAWASATGDERAALLEVIAKESGMDADATEASLATMAFPTIDEQMSAKWFDGGIATFMKGVADVFVSAGSIESARDSYEGAVNGEPLNSAGEL